MYKYTTLPAAIRYDVPGWPGFYVLIVSNKDDTARDCLLSHDNFSVYHYMFGVVKQSDGTMETIQDTVESAHWAVGDFLPEFVRECCDDRTE